MNEITEEMRAGIREGMADAKRRKAAIRANLNSGYDALMGSPMSPQDHPANNVSHPHGNTGRPDATLSTPLSGQSNVPQSYPVEDF